MKLLRFRIVDSWNSLPEDIIINALTLDTLKARLDKCWSGRKFTICTKLVTKQLKSQNKDYREGNENTRSAESSDAYAL